jgi:hypothetical protein
MSVELTPRELDVIAVAKHFLLQMPEHPNEPFEVKAELVPEWLGTILMLASRLTGSPGYARGFDGPREFAEAIIKEEAKARKLVGSSLG